MEFNAPVCFGYADTADYSCRRCEVLDACKARQAETRPACFGVLYDEENEECAHCLDASACIDEKEKEMTKRTVKPRRRRRRPVKVEETKKVARQMELAEMDSEYGEWSIPELREELTARGLEATGRKSLLIRRLMNDDEGVNVEEKAPEPEPEPEPVKPRRIIKRRVEEEPKIEVVAEPVIGTMADFFAAVGEKQTIIATRVDADTWQFSVGEGVSVPVAKPEAAVPASRGLRGKAWEREVYSEEYWDFHYKDAGSGKPWQDMSMEEKYEFAADLGVEWEEHANDHVNMMRCVSAVYGELGISKYKDAYKSKASRDALK